MPIKLTNVYIMKSTIEPKLQISKEEFGNLYMLHLQVKDLVELDFSIEDLTNLPSDFARQLLKIIQTSAKINS